jgi:hypothetical protein
MVSVLVNDDDEGTRTQVDGGARCEAKNKRGTFDTANPFLGFVGDERGQDSSLRMSDRRVSPGRSSLRDVCTYRMYGMYVPIP